VAGCYEGSNESSGGEFSSESYGFAFSVRTVMGCSGFYVKNLWKPSSQVQYF
jgi:hypothetical protein